jgi:hypothetical protein
MSTRALKIMVGKAVISDQFRMGILNHRRSELIRDFDLDPEERAEVLAIQASTPAEFYVAIDRIVASRENWRRLSQPVDSSDRLAHSLGRVIRRPATLSTPV